MPSSPEDGPKPLSCIFCRAKKIKCDRVHPCTPCTRSSLECVFPARKRNRRPRRTRQDELLNRLARLEGIVGKVDPKALDSIRSDLPPTPAGDTEKSVSNRGPGERGTRLAEAHGVQAAPSDDGPNKYLSGEFWSNLCAEVEGLKQALEQPSDTDSGDEGVDESSPESAHHGDHTVVSTSHALLGNSPAAAAEALSHPAPRHILYLASTYFSNVDIVIKVFHRPTVLSAIRAFATSGERHPSDPATEAIFFAIYFAAVTTLSDEACLVQLGEQRRTLVERWRLATEVALAKADYLNSTELEPLQALTIYIACLRSHNGSRASWTLLGVAVRLAQALGMHRDGSGSGFTPFVAEMRRRLWYQLLILDVRGCEDRGAEAIIGPDSYNTQMMTNINDDDFGPESSTPLASRDGPTDVTFVLCSAMSSDTVLYVSDPQARFPKSRGSLAAAATGPSLPEDEVIKHARRLEATFIDNADPSHVQSSLAAAATRVITLKLWLSLQYPLQVRQRPRPPTAHRGVEGHGTAGTGAVYRRISHEDMLRTAISIVELAELSRFAPGAERWSWWTSTYVQWHPLAVALAELCGQTGGDLVDRAWRVIDAVFPEWSGVVADTKRGTLWRPIKKLWKKAKAARARAQAQPQPKQMEGLSLGSSGGGDDNDDAAAAVATSSAPLPASPGPAGAIPQGFNPLNLDPRLESGGGELHTPSMFLLQEPADFLNFNMAPDLEMVSLDTTDWSDWNEFVSDAYPDANDSAGTWALGS